MIPPAKFRFAYDEALQRHVLQNDETTLHAGYELGRTAVAAGISALELASLHHDALESALSAARPDRLPDTIQAASEFFQEILSTFEMIHRGYLESAAIAAMERRNAAMLRQLSAFLGDASLAVRDSEAVAEVLRLVAEHARELTCASYSVAACELSGQQFRATSEDEEGADEPAEVLMHLEAVGAVLPRRVGRADWHEVPALRGVVSEVDLLTVPIVALDGRRIGILQLVGKRSRDFSDADEAIVTHLADMTAASLERSERYRVHVVA